MPLPAPPTKPGRADFPHPAFRVPFLGSCQVTSIGHPAIVLEGCQDGRVPGTENPLLAS